MNFNTADYELSAGISSQLPDSDLPEIVFSGRSNVGKSSLLNRILNRKSLARVSATPGKTITINLFRLDTVRFVDLPGYGYAKRPKTELERWSELVEGYFAADRSIAVVVQLVDMRHSCSQDDIDMLHYLTDCRLPFMVVLTKADKLNKTETAKRLDEIGKELDFIPEGTPVMPFSALKSTGTEEIRQQLNCFEKNFEIKG